MVSIIESPGSCDPRALLDPLCALAAEGRGLDATSAGRFSHGDREGEIMRFHFKGPDAGHEPIRLGLFAGAHGDEPAGCAALAQFLSAIVAEPPRAAGCELWAYPIVNPTGYEDRSRETWAGTDLNRAFWCDSSDPEIRLLEAELRKHRFDGVVTLHADDTCEGLYGYSHGQTMEEMLLGPALIAAEQLLARDRRAIIDGFNARDGVICDCFRGILAPPPGQIPRAFNLIFETPARALFTAQVAASVAALDTIIASYRRFIAHAQFL